MEAAGWRLMDNVEMIHAIDEKKLSPQK